jgi:hypothetical protein
MESNKFITICHAGVGKTTLLAEEIRVSVSNRENEIVNLSKNLEEEKNTFTLTNPYSNLPDLFPSPPKFKRNTNKTPPKKKRKK